MIKKVRYKSISLEMNSIRQVLWASHKFPQRYRWHIPSGFQRQPCMHEDGLTTSSQGGLIAYRASTPRTFSPFIDYTYLLATKGNTEMRFEVRYSETKFLKKKNDKCHDIDVVVACFNTRHREIVQRVLHHCDNITSWAMRYQISQNNTTTCALLV